MRRVEVSDIRDRLDQFGLTPSQQAIVLELVQGQTGTEIADRLGLSHQTIRNEMSWILRLVGVRNRLELTLVALGFQLNREH